MIINYGGEPTELELQKNGIYFSPIAPSSYFISGSDQKIIEEFSTNEIFRGYHKLLEV